MGSGHVLDDTEKFISPGGDGGLPLMRSKTSTTTASASSASCRSTSWWRCTRASRRSTVCARSSSASPWRASSCPNSWPTFEPPALRTILERRMQRDSIDGDLDDVITAAAVEDCRSSTTTATATSDRCSSSHTLPPGTPSLATRRESRDGTYGPKSFAPPADRATLGDLSVSRPQRRPPSRRKRVPRRVPNSAILR